jgi:hypothetical protein
MRAIHKGTKIRKRITLTMEPIYWTQAKALLGSAKIARHMTQKMVTGLASASAHKDRGLSTHKALLEEQHLQPRSRPGYRRTLPRFQTLQSILYTKHQYFISLGLRPHTKPFRKPSSKSNSRINPTSSIIDKVSRRGIQNSHLNQRLHICPDTKANEKICDKHIAGSAIGQCFACANE